MKILTTILIFVALTVHRVEGQTATCDPNLLGSSTGGALAYQQRPSRCEGLYALPVSGSARLDLVSLTDSFPLELDPKSVDAIYLEWRAPPGAKTLALRAESLRYKYYYQMDALAESSAAAFRWDMGVIKQADIRRPELGLLASTVLGPIGKGFDVYLPIAAANKGGKLPSNPTIEIIVTPTRELSELYYTVFKQTMGGVNVSVQPPKATPLGQAYYPQDKPIKFQIPIRNGPFVYLVVLNGVMTQGGSVGQRFRFYYAR